MLGEDSIVACIVSAGKGVHVAGKGVHVCAVQRMQSAQAGFARSSLFT